MDEVVPVFEAINLSSPIKLKYFQKKDLEPDSYRYRFHISLVYHSGLYWVTSMVLNLDIKNSQPVVLSGIFTDEEKDIAKKHIKLIMDIPEIQDWNVLWFSDGKQMLKEQFSELRNLWSQNLNLQTNNS